MKKDIRILTLTEHSRADAPNFPVGSYDIDGHRYAMGEGLVPLVQAFLTNLLSDEGSATLTPERGGGLMNLLGKYREFSSSLRAEVANRVRQVEREMKEEQERRSMSPEEKLDRVEILRVDQGSRPDEIDIQLALYAESGDAVSLALGE
jgi:hypothetical protein